MFLNMGFPEIATILVAALLLLGPQKLPEFARWLGRVVREIRRTTQEVRDAIDFEMEKEELERLRKEFAEHVNIDPALELEKAANDWMNDVEKDLKAAELEAEDTATPSTETGPGEQTDSLPVMEQTNSIHGDHGHSTEIPAASDHASEISDGKESLSLTQHLEADNTLRSLAEANEPKLEPLPVLAPPPEAVSRGRLMHAPWMEESAEPGLDAEAQATEFPTSGLQDDDAPSVSASESPTPATENSASSPQTSGPKDNKPESS